MRRRAWIHFTVRDHSGEIVFESGRPEPDGSIVGNDNDADPARFEPHHTVIGNADQVQIYEAIMAGPNDAVTTVLLTAVPYALMFLGAFVVGMLLTPPDVISQTLLAVPVYLLYELGILMSRIFAKGRESREDEAVATDGSQ